MGNFQPVEALPTDKRGGRHAVNLMDPELIEPLISYLEEGMNVREACDLIGVAYTTVRKWVKAGKQDITAGRETDNAIFAYRVTKAMAEAKHLRIKAINKAGQIPGLWPASAWWLERRYPQEFGRQDRINMNMSGSLLMNQQAVELTDGEADAIRSIIAKLGTGEGDIGSEESFGLSAESETEHLSLS